jgi:hypothetical protein
MGFAVILLAVVATIAMGAACCSKTATRSHSGDYGGTTTRRWTPSQHRAQSESQSSDTSGTPVEVIHHGAPSDAGYVYVRTTPAPAPVVVQQAPPPMVVHHHHSAGASGGSYVDGFLTGSLLASRPSSSHFHTTTHTTNDAWPSNDSGGATSTSVGFGGTKKR